MHEEADDLRMSSFGECAAGLAELQTLKFCLSDEKAHTTEGIELDSNRDQVSARLVWCQRKAGCLGECLNVFKLDQSQLIVRRLAIALLRIAISSKAALWQCLSFGESQHWFATPGRDKDVLDRAHFFSGA